MGILPWTVKGNRGQESIIDRAGADAVRDKGTDNMKAGGAGEK